MDVPDEFFADFLRGLFDGDGTFYTYWDTRWPRSFVYKISFASASSDFIIWFKDRLTQLYRVKGYICKGDGVLNIQYTKGDSEKFLLLCIIGKVCFFCRESILRLRMLCSIM